MSMHACVTVGESLGRYGFGDGHPFGPDRLDAYWKEACAQSLDKSVDVRAPVACDEADLERFHTPAYIARVKQMSREGGGYLDGGDTPAVKGIHDAARVVVGSVLDAVTRAMQGECVRNLVPIAGLHHARRDRAAGFCVYNDCGVAIETLFSLYGLERVAYVDIDAHHGDGVFYSFESDPRLLFADLHEDGRFLYPGTGAAQETGKGEAIGTKLNIPMPPEAGDELFMQQWPRVEAFLEERAPQFILLQAGADSIAGDPITHLRYTPAAHRHATERLCRLADRHCAGRLLVMGGGGYNRRNLALTWSAVTAALAAA